MSTKKTFDEKAAWTNWGKLAPNVNDVVNSKAGRGSAAAQRAALEKPPISKNDGRRKRATGRSAVFNTKLKPDFRAKLFAMADAKGVAVAALLEDIVAEWEELRAHGK